MQGKYIIFYDTVIDQETNKTWIAGVKYKVIGETDDSYIYGIVKTDDGETRFAVFKEDEFITYEIGYWNTSNGTRE